MTNKILDPGGRTQVYKKLAAETFPYYKCPKCDAFYPNTWDGHVCDPKRVDAHAAYMSGNLVVELDVPFMTEENIKIGRLKKRIAKLTKQRDHFKEQFTLYQKVISMQPFLMSRYESYTEVVAERKRVKDLEARVKEQALLIQELRKSL
jgi:hypothetical protein